MIVSKLGLKPGFKVAESGTGTGNLSVTMAKAIFPKGHLYTYEFNQVRVDAARQDFAQLGLDEFVTCTHRDVLADGFLLGDQVTAASMDACFLDLPSPERAVPHAYLILKTKGKVCNFSPCIEQVQRVAEAMATVGFYDIRTYECLNHEIENKAF
jgi:tRNA (adenine57-N1/adenine58-N1)-methyltransferase